MTPRVPLLARAILALVLHPEDRRYALADLEEELEQRAADGGEQKARRWYRRQVLRSVIPALRHRCFGSIDLSDLSSRSTTIRRLTMLGLLTDFRVAVRNQVRSPITALVTVLSLGLGIGAVTVTVALFHQLVLPSPAGLAEPEQLVTIYTSREDGEPYGTSSWLDAESLRTGVPGLRDLAAVSVRSFVLGRDTAVQPVLAEEVSGNYFAVTGIRPPIGRAIETAEADQARSDRVAVLSDRLWRSRFGADPKVVGSTVSLQGHPFVVIGVAPRGVRSRQVPLQPDVWVPLGSTDDVATSSSRFEQRDARGLVLIARMAAGVEIDAVRAQVAALGTALVEDFPEAWTDPRGEARSFMVVSEKGSRLNPRATAVFSAVGLFFLAATGLVLLIGCANAASLFLARAAGRSREIAVRRSLGASRSRLARLWLVDGLLPGIASGVVALLLTWTLRRALGSLTLPMNLPFNFELEIGPPVFALVAFLSVGVSILFAVVPTLIGPRSNLVVALKGEASSHRRGGRLGPRQLLVAGQCAAAVLLVIGAALFVRSLENAAAVDLGVSSHNVAVTSKSLDPSIDSEAGLARYREIVEQLRASPTVEAAAIARSVELTMLQMGAAVEVVGDGSTADPDLGTPQFFRNSVTPGYLEILGVPLLRGRTIEPTDRAGTRRVAVVNETFADRMWPGEEALGRTFTMTARNLQGQTVGASGERFEVIGVAGDGKYLDFDDGPTPYFWTALEQDYSPNVAVLVKARTDIESVLPELRTATPLEPGEIRSVEPASLSSLWSIQYLHLRIASRVLAWAGAFGLFLATLGIYGMVALAVTQRRRELALRLAIGAGRRQVVYQVVRGSLALVAGGLTVGLVLAVLLANLLRSVLVGVGPLDPLALVTGVCLLSLTAVVASIGPVLRATGIDPATALRQE